MSDGRFVFSGVGRILALVAATVLLGSFQTAASASAKRASGADGFGQSELTGISCQSMQLCTAVGFTGSYTSKRPLVGRWNGSRWSEQPVPFPAGQNGILAGVSCASASRCLATGTFGSGTGQPLVEIWNGTRWSMGALPLRTGDGGGLGGVSCPAVNRCVAVGGVGREGQRQQQPLAARWNGHQWFLQRLTGLGSLTGVSCPSTSSCFAVGGKKLEHWNGRRWTFHRFKRPDDHLDAVSCPSSHHCTVVGGSPDLSGFTDIYRWNGQRWIAQPIADRNEGVLNAVSCPSRRSCTAVGGILSSPGMESPQAARWNGTQWTYRSWDVSSRDGNGWLNSAYCASKRACIAVGGTGESTLVSTWNGRRWSSSTP